MRALSFYTLFILYIILYFIFILYITLYFIYFTYNLFILHIILNIHARSGCNTFPHKILLSL